MTTRNQSRYTQSSLRAERAYLGAGLFDLAVDFSRQPNLTKAAREEAIKSTKRRRQTLDGSRAIRTIREKVDQVAEQIQRKSAQRKSARWAMRPRLNQGETFTNRKPVSLRTGSLEDRLHERIARDVLNPFCAHYRTDSAGETDINLTVDPSKVGAVQTEALDWDYYSKATKYPKKITSTTITVPRAYWSRVKHHGLTVVDGLMTLDAQIAEGAPEGVELFAATWITQGRGYAIHVERGYIARHTESGVTYHGADAKAAVRGLARKIKSIEASAIMADLLAKQDIGQIIARRPNLTVTLQDARITGACEYGIRSWCERCGLDYEAGSATLADVYACYQQHPMPEARAAILHAIRRQRSRIVR